MEKNNIFIKMVIIQEITEDCEIYSGILNIKGNSKTQKSLKRLF